MQAFLPAFLSATVVSFLLSGVVLRFARRHHLVAEARSRDVHKHPTPRLGGVAMFGGLLGGFIVAYFVPQLRNSIHDGGAVIGLLLAASLIVVVGVLDDLYDLDWMIKLGAQILAGGILVFNGVQILSLPVGDTLLVASPTVNMFLTALLVAVAMNAVNFIDGLDGLAAGFAVIAAVTFFIYTRVLVAQTGESSAVTFASLIVVVLAGIALGFLPYNWHVAKMFMGDTGAMLIGLLLATAAISATGQLNPGALSPKLVIASYIPVILPVAVLALPLLDMTLAVIRRLRAGRSPFSADRKHLHHRLLDLGHSPIQVVCVIYVWSLTLAGTSLLAFVADNFWLPLATFIGGSLVCLVITAVPSQLASDWLRQRGIPVPRARLHADKNEESRESE